jgi:hypothetical protein
MDHNEEVLKFLKKCEEEDSEKYKELEKKYPILSDRRYRTIREKERTVGLIGLQPSDRLPRWVVEKYGLESTYEDDV